VTLAPHLPPRRTI